MSTPERRMSTLCRLWSRLRNPLNSDKTRVKAIWICSA
jgi:hypothetical protein